MNEVLLHPDRLYWVRAANRVRRIPDCPRAVEDALVQLEASLEVKDGTDFIRGRVRAFDAERGYGFISQADASEAIFFHRNNLQDHGTEILLTNGTPLAFKVRREEKGLQAYNVRVELTPESEGDALRNRNVRVTNKLDDFLFATDLETKAPVFIGHFAMRKGEWKRVAEGNELIVDLELVTKGPRAVRGSVRPSPSPRGRR